MCALNDDEQCTDRAPEVSPAGGGINRLIADYNKAHATKDRQAIEEAIRRRFTERYVSPVSESEAKRGFTMVAISSLMIEAFESFRKGWTSSIVTFGAACCARANLTTDGRSSGLDRYPSRRRAPSTPTDFYTQKSIWMASVMDSSRQNGNQKTGRTSTRKCARSAIAVELRTHV